MRFILTDNTKHYSLESNHKPIFMTRIAEMPS